MQRQPGTVVPIGEVVTGLDDGLVSAIREASPQARPLPSRSPGTDSLPSAHRGWHKGLWPPLGLPLRVVCVCAAVLLVIPATALFAQPLPAELFANVGVFQGGTDDGSLGPRSISFGGGMTFPVYRRLFAELDVQTSRVVRVRDADNFYKTRRTLVLPVLLYRWGGGRIHPFVGAGFGAEFVDSITRDDNFIPSYTPMGWREVQPRVFEIERSGTRLSFASRIGFVAFPAEDFGVRVDLYTASWHLGARIGVVYRFN